MRRTSVVALLASVMLVLAGIPAQAYQPPKDATFNAPRHFGGHAAQYKIVNTIKKAINKTRKTKNDKVPVINIATYLMDYSPAVNDLISACRRGVNVRVVLDEDIKNKNSRKLIKALNSDNVKDKNGDGIPDTKPKSGPCNRKLKPGAANARSQNPKYFDDRFGAPSMKTADAEKSVDQRLPTDVTWGKDGSYVKRCDGSCRGGGGNMHSKFFLFSNSGKARDTTMVSSSNLNRGGAELGWNDLFVMNNRPVTYKGYKKIHKQMTYDRKQGKKRVEVADGQYVSRFFPMKGAGKKADPTMQDLNTIKCSGPMGKTQIKVSMFYWKGPRGNYLLDKLVSLKRSGCSVGVIVGAPSIEIADRLRSLTRRGVITTYDSRWDFNKDGFKEIRTHAKYVLVKGNAGGRKASYNVWTGSQNWVAGSLNRGDEVTLNVRSKSAWKDYNRHWNKVKSKSRRMS